MLAILCELEQQYECRSLECELEQLSDEFQQQCQLAGGLQFYLKLRFGDSGTTGIYCLALCEINLKFPFW